MQRLVRGWVALAVLGCGCGLFSGSSQDDGAGSTALLVSNESDAHLRIIFQDITQSQSETAETMATPGELVPLANDGGIGYAPPPEEIISSITITVPAQSALVLDSMAIADLPWDFEPSGEYGGGGHTLVVTQAMVDEAE
jgi:hypothetical protein